MQNKTRRLASRQQGVSLIEVLVAVLIVAVGILGVAGLQVVSLQQNRSALLRAEALQLGNDILDRMRANPLTDYAPVALTDAPSSSVNCITNACDRNGMAEYDIAQWKCSINSTLDPDTGEQHPVCISFGIVGSLPGGAGSITKSGTVHEIVVEWTDDRGGNKSSVTLRTQTEAI
ncbi:MAG: type IV pilus modification protein PilV [Pseudomonadales bacterium]|nr:type IV pilus modification protein PilV [Pseudomonadales bacterium]